MEERWSTQLDEALEVHLPWSDQWNAERWVDDHGDDFRYVYPWKRWLVWDGHRWDIDHTEAVMRRAKDTIRQLLAGAQNFDDELFKKFLSHIKTSLSANRLEGMLKLARSEPTIPLDPAVLDSDPWLFNCANGLVHLKIGKLTPHWRSVYCAKMSPVSFDADASCPIWEAFLDRIFGSNQDVISFLQRAIGYALTGDTSEQCVFMLHGSGSNGKSTLIETIHAVMGDYSRQAEFSTFIVRRKDDGPRNDIAALHGARFVAANEVSEGKRLSEAVIKQMTGQDTVTCRRLYEEFFSFHPTFKLFLASNHRPVIKGQDHAIWRRVRLIPFSVTIPDDEQDRDLQSKLREELPGILAWAVRGCLDWQNHGLGTPPEVVEATAHYRRDMDTLGDFLGECCVMGEQFHVTSKDLYEAYTAWCEHNGEEQESQKAFGTNLTDRGFAQLRIGSRQVRGRHGIGLVIDPRTDASDTSRHIFPEIPVDKSLKESFRNNVSNPSTSVCTSADPALFTNERRNDLASCPKCGRTDVRFSALAYYCPDCGRVEP
jgi:putative DNA primase/helicase